MALKFLNKKGWHTGSLRNIENVWKAEQKQAAEQKKLEELRKQINEERERAEFRQLQEEAGLTIKQERLEFLYDSGLAVGKGSGFKALETVPKSESATNASSSSSAPVSASAKQSAVPGALFEDKPHSSNDAWRKLHSDPLLLIRQREQEALARIKNNPIKMAMIRKSVVEEKGKDKSERKKRKKHGKSSSKHGKLSSPENDSDSDSKDVSRRSGKLKDDHHKRFRSGNSSRGPAYSSDDESDAQRRKHHGMEHENRRRGGYTEDDDGGRNRTSHDKGSLYGTSDMPPRYDPRSRRRNPIQLSEEQRAAKLREMQMDADLHEEQRWKRLRNAADNDIQEANREKNLRGQNFLDAAVKSAYGAEKGGSSTIEESVRRRTYYSQGRSASESNAFRRS